MKLIKLNCQNCNGQIEINVDDMQAYCPYCGKKLLFDLEQMELVLAERGRTKRTQERTKRVQLEHEYRERKEKRDNAMFSKIMIGFVIFGILLIGLSIFMEGQEEREHQAKNEIQVAVSSSNLEDKSFEDVVQLLKSAGFENIELIENDDLVFGIFTKDGVVESVTINGHSSFSDSDWFPADAIVKITYHTFPED